VAEMPKIRCQILRCKNITVMGNPQYGLFVNDHFSRVFAGMPGNGGLDGIIYRTRFLDLLKSQLNPNLMLSMLRMLPSQG
jgi:hypothetical protein